MTDLFIAVLNRGLTATWLILAVLLLRFLLRRCPRRHLCLLWALVALRLVLPALPTSPISLVPGPEPIAPDILETHDTELHSGVAVLDEAVNEYFVFTGRYAEGVTVPVGAAETAMHLATALWLLGLMAMLSYMALSYLLLRRRLRESIPAGEGVYLCDRVATPFLLGLLRPRIYLPATIGEAERPYVIAHERAHLRRRDNWWKPLGFLLLSVFWFQPLLWLSYALLCRDLETACDEAVLGQLGADCRRPYADALITCAAREANLSPCPLAFGETGVKERITGILRYEKAPRALAVAGLIAVALMALFFLTDRPVAYREALCTPIEQQVSAAFYELQPSAPDYVAADCHILDTETRGDTVTVYASILEGYYQQRSGEAKVAYGPQYPAIATLQLTSDGYTLTDWWRPETLDYGTEEIHQRFPLRLQSAVDHLERYHDQQLRRNDEKARAYFAANDWGLTFDVQWTGDTTFDMVFRHDGIHDPGGTLTTGPEYSIWVTLPNGQRYAYQDALQVLNLPYASATPAFDTVLYTLPFGESLRIPSALYLAVDGMTGLLPAEYSIEKFVTLTREDGSREIRYFSHQFTVSE